MVRADTNQAVDPRPRNQRCSRDKSTRDNSGPWGTISDKSISMFRTSCSRSIPFKISAKLRQARRSRNIMLYAPDSDMRGNSYVASSKSKLTNSCACTGPCADHTPPTSTPDWTSRHVRSTATMRRGTKYAHTARAHTKLDRKSAQLRGLAPAPHPSCSPSSPSPSSPSPRGKPLAVYTAGLTGGRSNAKAQAQS